MRYSKNDSDKKVERLRKKEARRRERYRAQVKTRVEKTACPTPDKVSYANEGHANQVLLKRMLTAKQKLYVYLCRCGYWHMTRSPPR